ncbi:MAG: hypothetical protein J3R72DRAFT_444661 [Linnemannia gamsii]|nr:MAG: hypothetical protein J3R72DRAFT_444661 [Linnemannia gamsii]
MPSLRSLLLVTLFAVAAADPTYLKPCTSIEQCGKGLLCSSPCNLKPKGFIQRVLCDKYPDQVCRKPGTGEPCVSRCFGGTCVGGTCVSREYNPPSSKKCTVPMDCGNPNDYYCTTSGLCCPHGTTLVGC